MAKKMSSKNTGNDRRQTFAFMAPDAMSVQLAGDFTEWQKNAISMKREPRGIWRAAVALQPGTYHYRFIVDGQWRDDPECSIRVPNPFGSHDAIREVSEIPSMAMS